MKAATPPAQYEATPKSPLSLEAVSLGVYNRILMISYMVFHLGCFGEQRYNYTIVYDLILRGDLSASNQYSPRLVYYLLFITYARRDVSQATRTIASRNFYLIITYTVDSYLAHFPTLCQRCALGQSIYLRGGLLDCRLSVTKQGGLHAIRRLHVNCSRASTMCTPSKRKKKPPS